jgi:hypothetical protein
MRTRPPRLSLALGAVVATMALPTAAHAADVVDVPAPLFWDAQTHRRIGGDADRFELDDPSDAVALSTWYHLSYVDGGDRIQVHDHSSRTSRGMESDIAKSENVAWHVAGALLGGPGGVARPAEIPAWARPRTGGSDGTSAGIVFALAELDLLTPGRLAGDLRVAGTGTIGSDGVVTAVRGVDAKLAAARLAHADVMFAPDFPSGTASVTKVISHVGSDDPGRSIGDWLNTADYENAGRRAAVLAGHLALVQVDDVRQALAWLCGRTDGHIGCAVAHAASRTSVRGARPYARGKSSTEPSTGPSTSPR